MEDVVIVSIDVDPNEEGRTLGRYADELDFRWRFTVPPRDVLRALERSFGTRFLHPPSEPMFLVDTAGVAFVAPFGSKDEKTLLQLAETARVKGSASP